MTLRPDDVTRLLDGSADEAAKQRATAETDDAALQAIETGWKMPTAPDVFDAAFSAVHPKPTPWWRQWVPVGALVAAAVTVAVVVLPQWRAGAVDLEKGLSTAAPQLGLTLVVLSDQRHRLAVDETVAPGTRLGVRASSSRAAWVALEEQRGEQWVRLWPAAAGGARVEGGEGELGDVDGAVVLVVEPRADAWPVRLVGANAPLDREVTTSEARVDVRVK